MGFIFLLLSGSLSMYFMTTINVNLFVNSMIALSGILIIMGLILKTFRKYNRELTSRIFECLYDFSLFIGGIEAIVCYGYHILNSKPIMYLNFIFMGYIFIASILITPAIYNFKTEDSNN